MKAHYRTRSGRIEFEVEGQSPKDMFRAMAEMKNVFEAESRCGCCESENLRFRIRTVDGNDYFELFCEDCAATFNFGQTRKGDSLFPKRKDAQGMLPNRGWKVWRALPPGGVSTSMATGEAAVVNAIRSAVVKNLPFRQILEICSFSLAE